MLTKYNICRICEKIGCTPSQLLNEDDEWVSCFEIIAKLDGEEVRLEQERSKQKHG